MILNDVSETKKVKKAARPKRDEFELEDLANQLIEAHNEGIVVILHIWKGEPTRCKISKLDGQTQMVHIEVGYNTEKVKFIDILKVESAPG